MWVWSIVMMSSNARKLLSSFSDVPQWTAARLVMFGKSQPKRRISFLPESLRFPGIQRRKNFTEQKLLGYTPEEVYSVVADINKYKDFLPWCKESLIIKETSHYCLAKLAVGFPPLVEKYTSFVTFQPYTSLRSVAKNGRLFKYLETTWEFESGPKYASGPSTIAHIKTIFEFRSLLYAGLGTPIFEEIAKSLAQSFEARCQELYGPDHLKVPRRRSARTNLINVHVRSNE